MASESHIIHAARPYIYAARCWQSEHHRSLDAACQPSAEALQCSVSTYLCCTCCFIHYTHLSYLYATCNARPSTTSSCSATAQRHGACRPHDHPSKQVCCFTLRNIPSTDIRATVTEHVYVHATTSASSCVHHSATWYELKSPTDECEELSIPPRCSTATPSTCPQRKSATASCSRCPLAASRHQCTSCGTLFHIDAYLCPKSDAQQAHDVPANASAWPPCTCAACTRDGARSRQLSCCRCSRAVHGTGTSWCCSYTAHFSTYIHHSHVYGWCSTSGRFYGYACHVEHACAVVSACCSHATAACRVTC